MGRTAAARFRREAGAVGKSQTTKSDIMHQSERPVERWLQILFDDPACLSEMAIDREPRDVGGQSRMQER